ncbi:MAG TPA: FAD-dependent oxidoreductase, partial [Candidatus Dormibacteraeota bacterium]|nr:FAD-dependent oxidoreductase [Candidatus Dormibacteraeota bacterium]
MSDLPAHARAVVIGSGIVGNSVAYHLCRLGWRDVVLLDKGPLPNPGGSTGHASNFIYLVDHSKEMTALTMDSVRQYKEMGVFTQSGGIEVARTKERMQELTRRMASAASWGIEPVSLISPAEVKDLVPFIDESIILGGFYTPGVGVVDSLRAGTIMRERAQASGALKVVAKTEVLAIDVERGSVRCVRTTAGEIEAETVVITGGVWSPRLARMAGTRIPLTPAVHQMIDVGPVPRFAGAKSDIEVPIVRDMDTNMYERQAGGDLEIGSYAHRAIVYDPEDIPPIERAALSPTEFPFTQPDFEQQMQHALELMPEIVGDEKVGVKYAINGILSLTPDGMPVLGESPDVKGLWSAAAVWVKEGPGTGKALAEWMLHGESEIDLHSSDIARFHEHQKTRAHVRARAAEGFNKTYGIVHPSEQWASNRNVRLAPFHERERDLGAAFFEVAGWERPQWYESNAPLLEEFADRVTRRTAEWESRWWSPIINAEHLAMRERAGLFDLSAFAIFDVVGPGALQAVQGVTLRQMDVPAGRNVYTPVLSSGGGFKSDLTIMRLGEDHFRVVTGGSAGMSDKKWFSDHLPADGSAQIFDLTSLMTTIGLWGPRARDILASVTRDDVSNDGFKFGACRTIDVDTVRVLASRISYVGDLGWELYVPIEQGLKLWDMLWEAGRHFGMAACG